MADEPTNEPTNEPAEPPAAPPAEPPAEPVTPPKAKEPAGDDWRAALPDDLRKAAENFTSPVDAVKSAVEMRRKLSGAIVKPADDAAPEEWQKYYRNFDVPDDPTGYEFTVPDDLPDHLKPTDDDKALYEGFAKLMHDVHAPKQVHSAALEYLFTAARAADERQQHEAEEAKAAAEQALRAEWKGKEYDVNMTYAQRAIAEFGDDSLIEWLDKDAKSPGNDARMWRMMAKVGRQMSEHEHHRGIGDPGQQKSAQAELDEIYEKYPDQGKLPEAVRLRKEELFKLLHGHRVIPGLMDQETGTQRLY